MTQHRDTSTEEEYYRNLFGEPGNPDYHNQTGKPAHIHYIGDDRAVVEYDTRPVHWSDLPAPVGKEPRLLDGFDYLGDEMSDHSDDQPYEGEL